jgi:hypothetical protein
LELNRNALGHPGLGGTHQGQYRGDLAALSRDR